MSCSVCMAVYNGELFLKEQIDSILLQLNSKDELIISDDGSTDRTLKIIKSYSDPRLRLLPSRRFGSPSKNFEYTITESKNEIIFLADQDDLWHPDKIKIMTDVLSSCDLVVCDCHLIDEQRNMLIESFFSWNDSSNGLLKNILKNSFVGCCMAFHRKILDKALPFPDQIALHDQWIGLIASRHFNVKFIPQILVEHRRHENNFSSTGTQSKNSWNKKLISRLQLTQLLWTK